MCMLLVAAESLISEPGITATVTVNNNGNTNLYIQVEKKHTSPDISLLILEARFCLNIYI